MTILSELIDIKNDWQSGRIDLAAFLDLHNKKLEEAKGLSDTEKAKAFDGILKVFIEGLQKEDEYDSGKLYADSDNFHYVWEAVAASTFGPNFFSWYNSLYDG